jgi:hypothetical protein
MNKQRKTSHILNVFQYDDDGHVVLPASLTLTIAPGSEDNNSKVPTTAWVRALISSLGYVTLASDQTITGLKTIVRVGASVDVLNFKIGTDTIYGLKVAYNQNELVESGEATWSLVNTFNRNGTGFSVTPVSFFRGVLVTGERLLSASVNANLLDYYSNNPSGRYPVYAYNTGVQQFSTGIIVGKTTGVVNAATGAISDLPSGVVANFGGRVIGSNAVNSNEFVTLTQLDSYVPTSRTLTINGTTFDLSANRTWTIPAGVTSFNTRTGAITLSSGDVTGALGYTPYNATNPSGYTTNTGTVTSVGGTGTVSGLSLSGTVTGSGNLTLGGTLSLTAANVNAVGAITNSTSGTAGSISGFNNPTTAATANTIVYRDGSGHITGNYGFYSYINTTDDVSAGTISHIVAKFGDNYHRSATASKVQSFLGLGSAAYQNTGAFLSSSGSVTIGGYLTVTGVGTSSSIYMSDTDEGNREIHCNSNRIGFLTQGGAWGAYLDDSGNWFGVSSVYAPIFYDSDNPAYYGNFASTSVLNTLQFGTSTNNGRFTGDGTWGVRFYTDSGYIWFGPANSGHAHIYTDRSNFYFNAQLTVNGGSVINTNDIRATVFFDLNDTNYYLDPTSSTSLRTVGSWRSDSAGWDGEFNGKIQYHSNSWYFQAAGSWLFRNSGGANIFTVDQSGNTTTSGLIRIAANTNLYLDNNYGQSIVGVYASTRYQGVFAMGDAYKLAIDGTSAGNLYGIAWSHPNAGGVAGNLNTHGALILENGSFLAALSGSIRSRDDMRTPIFYDQNDTGYYADFNSTSNSAIRLRGGMLVGPNTTWGAYLQVGGNGHVSGSYANVVTTDGNLHLDPANSKAMYLNYYVNGLIYLNGTTYYISSNGSQYNGNSATATTASNTTSISSAVGGSYSWTGLNYFTSNRNTSSDSAPLQAYSNNSSGAIMSFHRGGHYAVNFGLDSDNIMRIGGWSAPNSLWQLDMSGNNYLSGSSRAPIFYDQNNTGYYIDPSGGSYFAGSLEIANGYFLSNGVGGSMYMTAVSGSFGGYLRTSGHMVLDQMNAGYNVYVLDGNSVGVVKNAGSQSWSAFSDRTIKTIHSVMENNLSKLESITPIYYSFNNFADDKNRIGLIAQEVQEHFPELVEVEPMTEKLVLDYTGLIPVLLGAIKELKNKVEVLESQL